MTSESIAWVLVSLGLVFLASLVADVLGRRTRLPRVTLLLLLGVSIGPNGLDLMPAWGSTLFPLIADLALVMVAFLLGGELTLAFLREHGRAVLVGSALVVIATAATVSIGLLACGGSVAIALLLGAVATSTDPIAVRDVVNESGVRGSVPKTLLGIVAVDDAWGIMTMGVTLALVLGLESPEAAGVVVWDAVFDIVGAILLGCTLGVPMALLTGRVRAGEPTLAEALGGVLLCGGLALLLDVSFLLAAMAMGVVVANLARHHRRPFRAIEGIEWPFMVLFFVMAGASVRLDGVFDAALLTSLYFLLRIGGRVAGGWASARVMRTSALPSSLGIALLPQAGIAIGMAFVVSERVPAVGSEFLAAAVAGTILFEIVGPILTHAMLVRTAGR